MLCLGKAAVCGPGALCDGTKNSCVGDYQGTGMLIKYNMTVKMSLMHSQKSSMERACEDNVVMVKINDTTTNMLVDSGAQSTVLGERQFNNLVKSGLRAKLQPEEKNLRVYGNGCLPVVGKFVAAIECHGRKTMETILVMQGEGRCLLGSPTAKRLQVLQVGPGLGDTTRIYSVGSDMESIVHRFPKVFSGVGKLSDYQLKLHIDQHVTPVAQKPRRIPYPLKDKATRKINELLDLDIIEKVSGPTMWVSPAVFAPKPDKDDERICVDMRRANDAILREKLPIPTLDEVLEELNRSTVFSKLDMNMGFHQIELKEGSRDITTFSAGDSLFHYKRLSFGVNSAPEIYQNIVRQTIAGCPGATNIANNIVVHGKTTEEHDTAIVNSSLQNGIFPTAFKEGRLLPSIKKITLDPDDFSNFRPITNLLFLSKVLERIVAGQSHDNLIANYLYPSLQSAYR